MRALVFGTTGQVARELARHLPDGVQLTALPRAEADLSDPAACAEAVTGAQADVVINAAAYTAVDRAEDEETLATVINGAAPGAIARAAAGRGLPFVHLSTDYVFDGSGSAPFTPEDETGPLNAYGRSKLAGEREIADAGGRHVILRTSWVFSAHGANFVKTMLRLAETRDRLDIVSDQRGGPTPAGEIAKAVWRIAGQLHSGGGASGIHHFSGWPDTGWDGFAREIFATAGKNVTVKGIPTAEYPTPAQRPLNSRLDCSTTEAAFGIERPDWRRALPDILQHLRKDDI